MIEIKGLQKTIENATAVNIESLVVRSSEVVGVTGVMDSGIKPLFDLLIGRIRPTLGSVMIAGTNPLTDRNEFSRKVGVMFLEDSLYSNRTPLQNLKFHYRLRGLDPRGIGALLARVGLADQASTRVLKLSSGLARRLAFGCAVFHQPEALILQEPFARCDQASIGLLSTLIRDYADTGGAVLILAEDDTHLGALCDTTYTMADGRISLVAAPEAETGISLPFKIPVRQEGRVVLLNPVDILYADAVEGKTSLHTRDEDLPSQYTLGELEERLARSGFFRAHRSYLVNLQHIKEVIPFTRNSYSLRLDDSAGTLVPLSRSAAAELKELLDIP